jgi:hypothetical protein
MKLETNMGHFSSGTSRPAQGSEFRVPQCQSHLHLFRSIHYTVGTKARLPLVGVQLPAQNDFIAPKSTNKTAAAANNSANGIHVGCFFAYLDLCGMAGSVSCRCAGGEQH